MSNIETGGPAFPVKAVPENYFGMTMRQYAAIKLKVPNSGVEWLDDMIRESLRNEFAAKAMQELLSDPRGFKRDDIALAAYDMADVMLKARGS